MSETPSAENMAKFPDLRPLSGSAPNCSRRFWWCWQSPCGTTAAEPAPRRRRNLTRWGYALFSDAPCAYVPTLEAVASLHGEAIYMTDFRRHECTLEDMTRVGVGDRTGCVIYRAHELSNDEDERQLGTVYCLKLSPTEFLKACAGGR